VKASGEGRRRTGGIATLPRGGQAAVRGYLLFYNMFSSVTFAFLLLYRTVLPSLSLYPLRA